MKAWQEALAQRVLDVVEGAQRLDRMVASYGEVASFPIHCPLPQGNATLVEAMMADDTSEPGFLFFGADPGGLLPKERCGHKRELQHDRLRAWHRRYYRAVRKPAKEAGR